MSLSTSRWRISQVLVVTHLPHTLAATLHLLYNCSAVCDLESDHIAACILRTVAEHACADWLVGPGYP